MVEFELLPRTLPQMVEERLAAAGATGIETMNFGVSGTGIESYFYRLRDVVMKLGPDSASVFFSSASDFIASADAYSSRWLPPLIDESPGRSIIGSVMPRTNWLLVNRLRQSEFLRGNSADTSDFEAVQTALQAPSAERLGRLVQFARQRYFPDADEATLAEILGRGNGRLLAFNLANKEVLPDWLVLHIIRSELNKDRFWSVRTREDTAAYVTPADVEANISWLREMDRVARSKGVPLEIFVLPPGSVDPDFVEFWKPWPFYYAWCVHCDLRNHLLVSALKKTDLSVIDLKADFDGIPGTYRKSDGHWTERGLFIGGSRVAQHLSTRLPRPGSSASRH